MARDWTGRQTSDKKTMDLATKVSLLLLGIIFLLAAIITPLVVLMSKTSHGTVSYGDFIYQYNIKDGNIYYDIKKYIGQNTENVIIPSEYNGAPVVGILKNAFNGTSSNVHKNIKQITFDTSGYGGISRIDEEAFVGLESLREFYLPSQITTIAENAFKNCYIKGDFVVEDLGAYHENTNGIVGKLVTIANNAFSNCSVGGTLIIKNASEGIVPGEVLNAFGYLGASECVLEPAVNVFNLGTSSFASFKDLETLTIYTSNVENTNNAYTAPNFDMSACKLLKNLNVLYGTEQDVVYNLTQKFVQAPITNLYFGEGVTKLGALTLVNFNSLKNVTVNNNVLKNEQGTVIGALGMTIDRNIMQDTQFSGLTISFLNEQLSVSNVLKIEYDSNLVKTTGNNGYSSALTRDFMNIFNKQYIKELTIGKDIKGLGDLSLQGLFVSTLPSGESFKLNFEVEGSNDYSAITENMLSSTLFSNITEVQDAIIKNVDVTGPRTASGSNSTIYQKFNTAEGTYSQRKSYNGSIDWGDAKYNITFDYNLPDLRPLGFSGVLSFNSLTTTNFSLITPPTDLNATTNEYALLGFVQTGDGNGGGTGTRYLISNMVNGTFVFIAEEWNVSVASDGKGRNVTIFALWEKKTYYNVTYVPQFNANTLQYAQIPEKLAYYKYFLSYSVGRVYEGSTLGLGAIVNFKADGTPYESGDVFSEGDFSMFVDGMPEIYQSGFVFVGWNTSADGKGQNVDENTVCSSDLTLYGIWEEIKYNVVYHATTGDFAMANSATFNETYSYNDLVDLKTGIEIGLSVSGFNIAGFSFAGWSLTSTLSASDAKIDFELADILNVWKSDKLASDLLYLVFGSSYSYEDGSLNLDCCMFGAKDLHLYGRYTPCEYVVQYNLGEGTTPSTIDSANISYVNSETDPTSLAIALANGLAIQKIGYVFAGWAVLKVDGTATQALYNLIENGEEKVSEVTAIELLKAKYSVASSDLLSYTQAQNQVIELVAVWKANELVVTFNANGGAGSESLTLNFVDLTALSNGSAFTKIGSSVVGWGVNASTKLYDVSEEITGEQLLKARFGTDSLTYEQAQTNAVTLYAIWQSHTYNLVIDFGDGTEPYEIEVVYGEAYDRISEEELAKHTKTGYNFGGIYTGENGTGTQVWNENGLASSNAFNVAFPSSEVNKTLYVNWTKTTYAFNFITNTKTGGDDYSTNPHDCLVKVLRGTSNIVSSSGVSLGDVLSFTYLNGEGYIFEDLFAIVGGKDTSILGADDIVAISLKNAGLNLNEITITDEFIENYLFNNSFNLIALFRAKEYIVQFSVDSDKWIVSDWGIDGNNGYTYIYNSNNNIIGIQSVVVFGKPFNYVKVGDGFSSMAWPALTISNGHFNKWAYKLGSVDQLINADTLVEEAVIDNLLDLEDGAVINLYAQCSDYEVYVANIVTPSLYSDAYVGYSATQLYAEGGTATSSGTETTISNLRKDAEVSITLKVASGYAITGLRKDGSAVTISGTDTEKTLTFTMPASDVSIEILAKTINYYVEFNKNNANATGSMNSMTLAYGETKALLANGFSLVGHNFVGWATEPNGAKVYDNEQEISNLSTTDNATVNLYAVWEAKTNYVVEYNGNGASEANITVSGLAYGDTLTFAPNNFTKYGYTKLEGWFVEPQNGTAITSSSMLVSNLINLAINAGQNTESDNKIVLYAHWQANTHTVTLDASGGTFEETEGWTILEGGAKAEKEMNFGDVFGTLPTPTKEVVGMNVIFDGWYLDENFTQKVTSNTIYETDQEITLYAKFIEEENTYTLNINPNGGTYNGNSAVSQVSYKYGDSLVALATEAVKKGYIFSGWFENSDGTGTQYTTTSTMPDSELTVYANWTAITYTVKYDSNNANATGTTPSSTHTYDISKELSANGFSLSGYSFAGWNSSSEKATSGVVEYTDKQSVKNLAETDGAEVTLYAVYTANTYTLSFNTNFGEGYNGGALNTNSILVEYNSALPSLAIFNTLPTKVGYTLAFDGWFNNTSKTNAVKEGAIFNETLVTEINHQTKTATVYAGWTETALPYALTLDANGGSFSALSGWEISADNATAKKSMTFNSQIGTLPAVSKTVVGYDVSLVGWWIDLDGDGVVDAGETFTTSALQSKVYEWPTALTAVAQWQQDARTDTPYIVYHYTENLDGTYSLSETQTKTGTTGSTLTLSNLKLETGDYITSGGKFNYAFARLTLSGAEVTTTTINAVSADATESTAGITKIYLFYSRLSHTLTLQKTSGVTSISTSPSATLSGNDYTITLKYGASISVSATITTGYGFVNWTLVSGSITFNSSAKDQTLVMGTTDATLKLNTSESEFTLTLDANGGTIATSTSWAGSGAQATKKVAYNSAIGTLPTQATATISKPGFTFVGWTTSSDGGGVTYTETSLMPATNLVIYASWQENSYTVTLSKTSDSHYSNITATGATVGSNSLTVKFGASVTMNITLAEGCYLSGASISSSSITDLTYSGTGKNVTVSFTYTLADNSTLILTTNMVSYKVVFVGNGGTLNGRDRVEISGLAYNNSTTINSQITSKAYANHTFTGWQVSYDGESGTYADYSSSTLPKPQLSTDISLSDGATLYLKAIWRVNAYTVNFTLPSGISSTAATFSQTSASVSFGNAYKLKDLSTITLHGVVNGELTMKGWNVYVNGTLKSSAYLDETDFVAGGSQSDTLELNFTEGNTWFASLGSLSDGAVITLEADLVATTATITLNLTFAGTDGQYANSATAGYLNNIEYKAPVGKTLKDIITDYIANTTQTFAITRTDSTQETVGFNGFTLDETTTVGLSTVILYTGSTQEYTIYFARNLYTIAIKLLSDIYTQVQPTFNANLIEGYVSSYNQTEYLLTFDIYYNQSVNLTEFANNLSRTGFTYKGLSIGGQLQSNLNLTINSNFVSNNLSTVKTLNIEVLWEIIPVIITFEELNGTFASSSADPNSTSISTLTSNGFVLTSTANVYYNSVKDIYYNATSKKFYRIIPTGTAIGGISGFMPVPYISPTSGQFVGWFGNSSHLAYYYVTDNTDNKFYNVVETITDTTTGSATYTFTNLQSNNLIVLSAYNQPYSEECVVLVNANLYDNSTNCLIATGSTVSEVIYDGNSVSEDRGPDAELLIPYAGDFRLEITVKYIANVMNGGCSGAPTSSGTIDTSTLEKVPFYQINNNSDILDDIFIDTAYNGKETSTTDKSLYAAYGSAIVLDANPSGDANFEANLQMNLDTGYTWAVVGTKYVSSISALKETSSFSYLPSPTMPGYRFVGWFTGKNGTGTQLTSSTSMPSATTTYYASYEQAITVKFMNLSADGLTETDLGSSYYQYVQYGETISSFPILNNSVVAPRLGFVPDATNWKIISTDGTTTSTITSSTTITEESYSSYISNRVLKVYVNWVATETVNITFKTPNSSGTFGDYQVITINKDDTLKTATIYDNVSITMPNISNLEDLTDGNYHIDDTNKWLTCTSSLSTVSALATARTNGTTTNFTESTVVSASTTVYANAYTVYTLTFVANLNGTSDNTVVITMDNIYQGKTLTLPTPENYSTLQNSGYRYVGWSVSRTALISGATVPSSKADVNYQSNFNTFNTSWTISEAQITSLANASGSKNLTLYAVWGKTYTLQFNANGGIVTGTNPVTGVCHGDTNFTKPNASLSGYQFTGWVYTKATSVSLSAVNATYAEADVINVTATYQKIYTINYYKYDSTSSSYILWDSVVYSGATTVKDGSSLQCSGSYLGFNADRLARCVGWGTSESSSTVSYSFGATVSGADLNLYAKYQLEGMVVFMKSVGGSTSIWETRYALPGQTLGNSSSGGSGYGWVSSEPTATGYTFIGWSTVLMGTTANFTSSSTLSSDAYTNEGQKVYSVFEQITYTVTIVEGADTSMYYYEVSSGNITSTPHGSSIVLDITLFSKANCVRVSASGSCSVSSSTVYFGDDAVTISNITSNVTITITASAIRFDYTVIVSGTSSYINEIEFVSGTIAGETGNSNNYTLDIYKNGVSGGFAGEYLGSQATFNLSGVTQNSTDYFNYSISGIYNVTYTGNTTATISVALTATRPNFVYKDSYGNNYSASTLQDAYANSGTRTIYAYASGSATVGGSTINIQAQTTGLTFTVSMADGGSVYITGQTAAVTANLTISSSTTQITVSGASNVTISEIYGGIQNYHLDIYTTSNIIMNASGWSYSSSQSGSAYQRYIKE